MDPSASTGAPAACRGGSSHLSFAASSREYARSDEIAMTPRATSAIVSRSRRRASVRGADIRVLLRRASRRRVLEVDALEEHRLGSGGRGTGAGTAMLAHL